MFKKSLAILLFPVMLSGCYETEKADKIGTIVKVGSGEGIFNKTVEAEMIRGGFSAGSGASGQSFHFTVEDPKVAEQLRKAMDEQKEIKITYHREFFTMFRSESHSTFLDSFEVMEKKAAPAQQSSMVVEGINPKLMELLKVQSELLQELTNEVNKKADKK